MYASCGGARKVLTRLVRPRRMVRRGPQRRELVDPHEVASYGDACRIILQMQGPTSRIRALLAKRVLERIALVARESLPNRPDWMGLWWRQCSHSPQSDRTHCSRER